MKKATGALLALALVGVMVGLVAGCDAADQGAGPEVLASQEEGLVSIPPGLICSGPVCTLPTSTQCYRNEDCPWNYYCEYGQCKVTAPQCRWDSDCSYGYTCWNGNCIEGGGESCTDIPPNRWHTCWQQASWGRCNEWWMQGFCNKSCGRCGYGPGPGPIYPAPGTCSDNPPPRQPLQLLPAGLLGQVQRVVDEGLLRLQLRPLRLRPGPGADLPRTRDLLGQPTPRQPLQLLPAGLLG